MMRRFFILSIASLIFNLANLAGMNLDKVSPSLAEKNLAAGEWVNVVAIVKSSSVQTPEFTPRLKKEARGVEGHAALIAMLQRQDVSGSRFVQDLNALANQGLVGNIKSYWITNAVSFSIDASRLDEITSSSELEYLLDDQPLELVEPVAQTSSESGYAGSSSYFAQIGVREMWQMGYTGHGRLVCSFDTGVEGTHPALVSNWSGNSRPASQSWFDPYGTAAPVDLNGHGTHTMGLMVGRDGADTIGAAFNAQWMSASVIDRGQSLNKTISDIIAAFEWAADPDGNPQTVSDLPDVISNSWGIPKGLMTPCDQTFWSAIDNLEALGVVVIFACGNEGPNPATIRNPADIAFGSTNSFSIGAVDQSRSDLLVANFSSRGPANCDAAKVKPELVAPGVSLRSSYKGGTYRLMSGTSMSAPVVAGCIALLREYNPDATVAEIKNALIQSAADLGSLGQDNDYGYGFINVKRALDYLPEPLKPRIHVEAVSLENNATAVLAVGTTTDLNLTVTNASISSSNLRGVLYSNNPHVFILANEAEFGGAPTAALVDNVTNPFRVKIDHTASEGSEAEFTVDFYNDQFGYLNSADFKIVLGQPLIAGAMTLGTDRLNAEITNFGVSRRLYDYSTSVDPLSFMSLMIADDNGNVYDALSESIGFRAVDSLRSLQLGATSEVRTSFKTANGDYAIGLTATAVNEVTRNNFLVLAYDLKSNSALPDPVMALALACDFDFAGGEAIVRDGDDYIVRSSSFDRYIGVRVLPEGTTFGTAVSGSSIKDAALTAAEKHTLLTSGTEVLLPDNADNALLVGANTSAANPTATLRVGFVIASGNSLDEIRVALQAGQAIYSQATDVDDDDTVLPQDFSLEQNFPNPFNPETRIDFSLPKPGSYRFEIINALGQRVKTIEVEDAPAGTQHVTWDGKNTDGFTVASGVYFYKLTFSGNSQTRKMVLMK